LNFFIEEFSKQVNFLVYHLFTSFLIDVELTIQA